MIEMVTVIIPLAIALAFTVPDVVARSPVIRSVIDIWTPRERILPSEWAERERELNPDSTPTPGKWRNDYLPWIKSMLDAFALEPWRAGWICMKYAQAGVSDIAITLSGYLFDYEPGPTLFICSRQSQARKFSIERYDYMIAHSEALSHRFRVGKANHETIFYKEAQGGPLMMAGSSSPNEYISNPCRYGFADEVDDLGNIPGHGDAWHLLETRTGEYKTRVRCGLFGWAHPTQPKHGIHLIWENDSDQREWMVECPHCGESFIPRWDDVEILERDPDTARYLCPQCTEEITDAQRWAASWDGRFESQLPEEQARKRRFIGFHISKLCHPRITLHELAVKYCACITEAQLKVFYNKELGLPFTSSSVVLTEDMIRDREHADQKGRVCPGDTLFITAGVDVQAPRSNPTLYFTIVAWTKRGHAVLIEYGRVKGWSLLDLVLREFHAKRPGKGDSHDDLRISGCMIDYGYETQQVYSFCRQEHGGVPCLPYKHTDGVKEDMPTRRKDTVDPVRPELGALPRLETCRHYWMGRTLGRFSPMQEELNLGQIVLPIGVDKEFVNHILANVRFDSVDEHGHAVVTYIKDETQRDDWLQCLVGAEVAAVAKGLDRLHEAIPVAPQSQHQEFAEGTVEPASRARQREPRSREQGRYRGNRTARSSRRVW